MMTASTCWTRALQSGSRPSKSDLLRGPSNLDPATERRSTRQMKTQIYISHEYNAVFEDVGRKIARGDPPLWLLVGLNHFSETFIGGNRRTSAEVKRLRDIIERMDDAAGLLLKWLPAYEHMGLGLRCPDDVRVVLARLPY